MPAGLENIDRNAKRVAVDDKAMINSYRTSTSCCP